jgi:hypothetical protein
MVVYKENGDGSGDFLSHQAVNPTYRSPSSKMARLSFSIIATAIAFANIAAAQVPAWGQC